MQPTSITLKVLLPFQVFAEKIGVTRIVAETREGAFGILLRRLDCVAALEPGILICESARRWVSGWTNTIRKAEPGYWPCWLSALRSGA